MAFTDSFRTARWLRTINLVLQALLFLTFFGGLNYLASNHHWRYDLTRHRRFSLSPETLSYLHNLNRPVQIVVTIPLDSDIAELAAALPDIQGLLREYAYATEGNPTGKVSVEYLDVYKRRRDADRLAIDQPNAIFLLCGDRRRSVLLGELYRFERKDGQLPERTAFQGEQAITAALLDVSSPARKKIYFLTGHSELRPGDATPERGLSTLAEELRRRNFDLDLLDLTVSRRVPDDASLVIAAGPQGIEPIVQEQLRQYLSSRAGRMIVMLTPAKQHGLDQVLEDWGVLDDKDLIWDNDPHFITEDGDLLVKAFLPHPITQTLINLDIGLRIGLARSVRPDPSRPLGNGLTVTTLAATSTSAWGERSSILTRQPEYNSGVDLKGHPKLDPPNRLGIIVASERVGTRGNLDFSVPRGRLVVFGTADIVTNNRFAIPANQYIFLSAVNWTVDRDTQLKIPPRPIERFQLSLSQEELLRLRYCLLFVLPGVAAVLGLAVYWTRRA
jgi:hypothetical protein